MTAQKSENIYKESLNIDCPTNMSSYSYTCSANAVSQIIDDEPAYARNELVPGLYTTMYTDNNSTDINFSGIFYEFYTKSTDTIGIRIQ